MMENKTPETPIIRSITRALEGASTGVWSPPEVGNLPPDVRELVTAVDTLIHQKAEADAMHRKIIADAGHDFRTPITAMRGELEVALRSDRSVPEYRRVIESCLQEVERLKYICDSLSTLASLETPEVHLELREVPIANLLLDEVAAARRIHREHEFEYEAGTCMGQTAEVDAKLLALAVSHLLQNCAQHTAVGTRVLVTCSMDAGVLKVSVDDSGEGLADDQMAMLTGSFYRADEARGRQSGAGLGLAIATRVALVHRGTLRVNRSELGGLRVALEIPPRGPSSAAS